MGFTAHLNFIQVSEVQKSDISLSKAKTLFSNMIFYKPISIINNYCWMCHSKMRRKPHFTSASSRLWFEQNRTSKFLGHLQKNNWLNKLNDPSTNYMSLPKSTQAPVNYKWNTYWQNPIWLSNNYDTLFFLWEYNWTKKELYLTFCEIKNNLMLTLFTAKS